MSATTTFIESRVCKQEISLRDFLEQFHAEFEKVLDISFMDYLLELSKRENKGQFIVHHENLIEYGIANISGGSGDIAKRLKALGMTEDENYRLRKFSEPVKQGDVSTKNIYFLTPKAFKICLIRAQKHKSQEIDVSKYADYYLFLEEVVGYYMEHQTMRRDSKISDLTEECDDANATVKGVLIGPR